MKNTKKLAAMIAALTLTACSIAPMFSFAFEESDLTAADALDAYNAWVLEQGEDADTTVDAWVNTLDNDTKTQYGLNENTNPPANTDVKAEAGKIKFSGETAGTHKYVAYKIFSGTAEASGFNGSADAKLNDPVWNCTTEEAKELITALKEITKADNSKLFTHKETVYYTDSTKATVSEEKTEYFEELVVEDFGTDYSAAAIADALGNYVNSDSDKAKALADEVAKMATKDNATAFQSGKTDESASPITFTEPTGDETWDIYDGYYVIVEKTTTAETGKAVDDDDAYTGKTAYLLGVFDASAGAVVNVKASAPKFQKKLKDIDDSTGNKTGWQDSADYDIGDDVEFQLKATLPNTYDRYKQYQLVFHDNFRAKKADESDTTYNTKEIFTFKQIDKVYVDVNGNGEYDQTGDILLSEYTTENTTGAYAYKKLTDDASGYDFEVTINDLKGFFTEMGTNKNAAVIVEYTATLNGNDVVIGADGNWNDAYMTYTKNPNWKGSGSGTPDKPDTPDEEDKEDSPVDTTVVFTYQTVINKVDSGNQDLAGAEFTLYKKYVAEGDKAIIANAKKFLDGAESTAENATVVACDKTGYTDYYMVAAPTAITSDSTDTIANTFEFKGLDDGEYLLVETKTPTGYKEIDPIPFTVSAVHTQDTVTDDDKDIKSNATALELIDLNGQVTNGAINLNNLYEDKSVDGKANDTDKSKNVYLNGTLEDGKLVGNVVNTSGSTLPSTGGIGTTIFYLGGGAMVAVAGVFLITKKRMGKSEN